MYVGYVLIIYGSKKTLRNGKQLETKYVNSVRLGINGQSMK